jgi:hypothetical protein
MGNPPIANATSSPKCRHPANVTLFVEKELGVAKLQSIEFIEHRLGFVTAKLQGEKATASQQALGGIRRPEQLHHARVTTI